MWFAQRKHMLMRINNVEQFCKISPITSIIYDFQDKNKYIAHRFKSSSLFQKILRNYVGRHIFFCIVSGQIT